MPIGRSERDVDALLDLASEHAVAVAIGERLPLGIDGADGESQCDERAASKRVQLRLLQHGAEELRAGAGVLVLEGAGDHRNGGRRQ